MTQLLSYLLKNNPKELYLVYITQMLFDFYNIIKFTSDNNNMGIFNKKSVQISRSINSKENFLPC